MAVDAWLSARSEAVAAVQARGFTQVTHVVPEKHHLNTKSSHPDRCGEDCTCGHSCQTPDCSNNGERGVQARS